MACFRMSDSMVQKILFALFKKENLISNYTILLSETYFYLEYLLDNWSAATSSEMLASPDYYRMFSNHILNKS